jgi:hypothetical protein
MPRQPVISIRVRRTLLKCVAIGIDVRVGVVDDRVGPLIALRVALIVVLALGLSSLEALQRREAL